MNEVSASADLVAKIIAKKSIAADDVAALRRDVFRDGVCDAVEADTVFELDRACAEKDAAWTQFYVDALTDFVVMRTEPKRYISDANAELVIDKIVRDGRIDSTSELILLVNMIDRAVSCPESLVMFVLEAVRDSVLQPDSAAYGEGRRPNVIDAVDVEIIRKVIYSGAGGGGFTVTRREADLLFDLNNATVVAKNHDSWRDLFVKATANHLMFPMGAPEVPDAAEAARRDDWLAERRGVGGLLGDVGKTVAGLRYGKAWRDADIFGTREAKAQAEREAAETREALSRETIDEAEAKWLLGRIAADGVLHDNEKALLAFIAENSPNIHPAVRKVIDEADG